MASIYGNKLKISIFGQSHSAAIGVTIDGLPAGFRIDFDELNVFLKRRAPGQGAYATKRKEADLPEFLAGVVDGVTCGAPLTVIIRNTDTRSGDYDQLRDVPRPSHADYTAYMKHGESRDFRGGGAFSGRLTAPLCVAGGICLQLLQNEGIHIAAHIAQVGNVTDRKFDPVNVSLEEIRALQSGGFPVLDKDAGKQMLEIVEQARVEGDSVGGVVECCVIGMPVGVGDPIFDGIENRLAAAVFGIPAVKGIEFGNGFAAAGLRGSQNNDGFYMREGRTGTCAHTNDDIVRTRTNNHGGVLGGITSGMPIVFRVAFKPTPSVSIEQDSVSFSRKENVKLAVTGRHDPCIVPRAVPCVEAAAAVALYDAMLVK